MPRYTEKEARAAIASSFSFAEALRKLGLRPAGGNHALFRKWIETWDISTDHFDAYRASRRPFRRRQPVPLADALIVGSTYPRAILKARLYEEGLKQPVCELCGQGEEWEGRRMGEGAER